MPLSKAMEGAYKARAKTKSERFKEAKRKAIKKQKVNLTSKRVANKQCNKE